MEGGGKDQTKMYASSQQECVQFLASVDLNILPMK